MSLFNDLIPSSENTVIESYNDLIDNPSPRCPVALVLDTVTAEVLPNPVTVGMLYILEKPNVSSVVITDSSGTPKTLPPSQYSVVAKHGSLLFLDVTTGGPYVEPFQADYAYGAASITAMFTQPLPERWVRFEGLNTADSNREVVIDL